jgi:hypothetical protein
MLMPILLILAFIAISVPLVAAPLRRRGEAIPGGVTAGAPAAAASGYETTLLALRDLELDHQLGVVSDDDYGALHEQLVVQAANSLEGNAGGDHDEAAAAIDAAIERRRQQRRVDIVRFCPQCGRAVEAGDLFCAGCGHSLR